MASGSYLSVGQFAGTYGQTPAKITALTSYLASLRHQDRRVCG